MAYQKPGIEISQVQKSKSAILTTPDLEGVVEAWNFLKNYSLH